MYTLYSGQFRIINILSPNIYLSICGENIQESFLLAIYNKASLLPIFILLYNRAREIISPLSYNIVLLKQILSYLPFVHILPSFWEPLFYTQLPQAQSLYIWHISEIMQYLSFCFWLISLNIVPSVLIHGVASDKISLFCFCWVVFYLLYFPHFLYLFIHYWAVRLFPQFGSYG
jgi:hypothetical protein